MQPASAGRVPGAVGHIFWVCALCRRPLLADRGRCYDNYEYAFFVGFHGTLKAYMKKKSSTIMVMFLMMHFLPTLGMLIIITMHLHYRQQL